MPRGKDTKVWNEDLVTALRAREELCRQRYSEKQYLWRDGERTIRAIRQDIYMFKTTGRIVGLPRAGISKTVEEECRAIIEGRKPIFPEGYVPISTTEAAMMEDQKKSLSSTMTGDSTTDSNPFRQDPYLKRIKMRGGSYAILMALHFSQADSMTKVQLCSAAQHYCDEEMEPNFSSGRAYGAWSSKKTLIKHGLIQERRTTQMGRRGHVCNGVFEYSMTNNGKLFTQAMLEKFPLDGNSAVAPSQLTAKTNVLSSSFLKENMKTQNLQQPTTKDEKKEIMLNRGKKAPPKSNHLKMPIENQPDRKKIANKKVVISLDSDSSDSDSDDDFDYFSQNQIAPSSSNFSSLQTTQKSIKSIRHLHSLDNDTFNQSSSDSDDDSIREDKQTPKAVNAAPPKLELSQTVIEILSDSDSSGSDSDNDDKHDEEEYHWDLKCNDTEKRNLKPQERLKASELCSVLEEQIKTSEEELVIVIDSRERNRNATPREMRNEIERHVSSGDLSRVWPYCLGSGTVEELQLNYGDFVYEIRKNHQTRRLPISIERKRVSDLVQRSYKADHWSQLSRMRDCCKHAILLVEGNTSKTSQFSSYGNLESEDSWSPDHHSIDDEHAFYRFLGRAILSSPTIKIWQTKDEQATYRSVGAVGVVSALLRDDSSIAPTSVVSSKVAINKLYEKLKSLAVPWQIARRLSEELGSITQLNRIYDQCERSCKWSVLVPIINGSCSSIIKTDKSRSLLEYGTVNGWSEAIMNAWFSKLDDPTTARLVYDEYKEFADDRSKLLAEIHAGKSGEAAVQESNRYSNRLISPRDIRSSRKVRIEAISHLAEIFPQGKATDTFYEVESTNDNPLGLCLPSIVIQTSYEGMSSHKLVISVLDGTSLVEKILHMFQNKTAKEGTDVAMSVANEINGECTSFLLRLTPPKDFDRRVLIIRGVVPALDAAAKCSGYRPEIKIVTDLVMAYLMLRHNLVVVQAFRRKGSLEMILREFAMSCFYYQLTTKKAR